jgi:glycosyltransferase involved in cell wall biosynthesis
VSEGEDRARRRLWIFTELYHPELTSSGRFLTGIAEGLAASRDVHVVCSQPTYAARGVRAPRLEVRNGVEIRRCRSTTLDKDVLGFRFLNGITLGLAMLARAWRDVRPEDVVLVVTTPPLLPLCVASVVAARGGHMVVLVHDVYPDVLCVGGFARPGSPAVKAVSAAYRWVFRMAERVVALGRDMQKLLVSRGGSTPVVVIPNWGEVDEITPQPRAENRLLARLGLQARFVVHYLGNMGRTHDLDVLLEAAKLTRGSDRPFSLHGRRRAAGRDQRDGTAVSASPTSRCRAAVRRRSSPTT